MPSEIHQVIRYAIIGIASNLAGYTVYLALTFFLVEPKIAMTVVYLAGASIGYFGNRQWTFTHEGQILNSLTKYSITHACGYLINFFILYIFVDQLSYTHQAVQLIAILVVALFLFYTFKKFVFSNMPKAHSIHTK